MSTGKLKPWSTRYKLEPSYPEKFFIKVFENNNIEFEREVKIGRYFADFVVKNLVVEVDGKQHEYPDRKLRDTLKDDFLMKSGYVMHRIKWLNPVNEKNRCYIQGEIKKLMDLIKNMGD